MTDVTARRCHPAIRPRWWLIAAPVAAVMIGGAGTASAQPLNCCCTNTLELRQCQELPPSQTSCPSGFDTIKNITGFSNCAQVAATINQKIIESNLKPGWVTAIIGTELIPAGCRVGPQARPQDCDFRSVLQVVVNITRLILGVVGSLALAMFIYGGFLFLLSGGAAQRVDHAKQVLRNATIGIGVIFLSWTIVNLLLTLLTGSQNFGAGANVFNTPWNAGPPAAP